MLLCCVLQIDFLSLATVVIYKIHVHRERFTEKGNLRVIGKLLKDEYLACILILMNEKLFVYVARFMRLSKGKQCGKNLF